MKGNRTMKTLFACLACCLVTTSLYAQTVVVGSTSGVQFAASVDHNSTINVLTDYTAAVKNAAGQTVLTLAFGKPTPDGTNSILVQPMWSITQFNALPSGTYTLTVIANGPSGSNASVPSDPFVRPGAPAAPGKPIVKP